MVLHTVVMLMCVPTGAPRAAAMNVRLMVVMHQDKNQQSLWYMLVCVLNICLWANGRPIGALMCDHHVCE